uniref:Uncharacterized protein n=1 Tax=Sphaeramia orbicularis TaxID=375764 RepID=A0A673C4K3_9TELE
MGDNPVTEEVKGFNRSSLKKTQTKESTVLPTQAGKCLGSCPSSPLPPLFFCSPCNSG